MSSQHDLFQSTDIVEQQFTLPDGELRLIERWLDIAEAERLFAVLSATIAWDQSTIRLYGRPVKIPRLNAWYGDSGAGYSYSGTRFEPRPWTAELSQIKSRLEQATGAQFNSVLCNLYRDGNDSVAWHSDDEPELGENPLIASLSMGETRRFLLKHRRNRELDTLSLPLESGSLLVMSGALQHHWLHALPKSTRPLGPRINLTFRQVKPAFVC